jgi:hypothetical protein
VGFRFYKSFRVLPGVRLNLSKSGLSTTLGIRGANVNLRRGRKRMTLGLPGSGLSYVKTRQNGRPTAGLDSAATVQPQATAPPDKIAAPGLLMGILLVGAALTAIVVGVLF